MKIRWQKIKLGETKTGKNLKAEELVVHFLPEGLLDDFELTNFDILESPEAFGETYTIELTEKNIVPLMPEEQAGVHIRQKGFSTRRVLDFPIRGRKTILQLRRRKWQISGSPGIYMRSISVTAHGVKLSKEFAFFFEGED